MRVLKFGGTSVANAERVINVADIAVNTAKQTETALVLSAPAKVTNLLVSLVNSAVQGGDGSAEFAAIRKIVEPMIGTLALKYERFDGQAMMHEFNTTMDLIARRVQGIALLGQCPELVEAFIESRGESFSISIMAELLQARGYRVRVIDPVMVLCAEGGILESSVNIEESKRRYAMIAKEPGAITLMAGFCGGNANGDLVLLGRNGSDYSAACLAAVAGAECCEIWTDVDGVYSCDPRSVPDAVLLKRMSYKEAMELSYFGAKVLHPRTIAPIAQFHIPCLIKNTMNPQGEGTLIAEETDRSIPIKGISDLKNVSLVNVQGPGMKGMVGMAGRLFSAVSQANISIVLITQSSSEYSITFCIHSHDALRVRRAIEEEFLLELREGLLDPIEIIDKKAIISVVGDGMRTMRGTSGKFFRALAQANINVNAIAQGSSERSISAVIEESKVAEAIAICHMTFFSAKQILDVVLVGVGGVGSELLRQIAKQQQELSQKQGIEIRVVGIANSRHFLTNANGIDLSNYVTLLKQDDLPSFSIGRARQLIDDSHLVNPVLVDCTSDERLALSYIELMQAGFHVVTPNKKANTGTLEYYRGLRQCARTNHRKFLYEANVGAGLPVINTLQNLLAAGDELIEFSGIMSGTLSYIFGLVEDGMTLSEATRDAYEKGLTEPNPRDDLEGTDVARKLLILARECGYALNLSDVEVEGAVDEQYLKGNSAEEVMAALAKADELFNHKVAAARAEGKVLRYVASIKDGKCSCKVEAVGPHDPLFKVRGGENALAFTTAYYKPLPLVIRGYGAGTAVTAAGVLSDVLRLQNWTREG
ncbi:MAG: bifunctional aspartate kinase/homoserine dehydrogenase I [Candidatus Anaerobiospirillum merdipullorum]|uniref:Bifunctional aspartokinase/homoserine dehydrogenase n=1 Tax=Candidatus Anaerobiospirillum merdipullorum TaxID=2838450 RepID=A0A9E2NRD6_9GAMM|nr:bifunctional aspartate kinase/homoserine dehydrogenase I [Candidatus Anaerobiospirillum merdipullorum]